MYIFWLGDALHWVACRDGELTGDRIAVGLIRRQAELMRGGSATAPPSLAELVAAVADEIIWSTAA